MDDEETYEELANELMGEFGAFDREFKPETRNSIRGEMAVMWALHQADRSLTPGGLAETSQVSSARIANILRSLEEKGLVERHHSLVDRRNVEVSLTVRGRATADAQRSQLNRRFAGFLRELGKNDTRELLRIMRKSRDIMEGRRARRQMRKEGHAE